MSSPENEGGHIAKILTIKHLSATGRPPTQTHINEQNHPAATFRNYHALGLLRKGGA